MTVKFIDNSINVKAALGDVIEAFLHEAAGEVESQAKRNTPVDTGQLKGSWKYVVSGNTAKIGSAEENAIWNEFGTGEYALNHNGRKTPWYVPVEGYTGKNRPTFQGKVVVVYGKSGKAFYKTDGKKPKRSLYNAFKSKRPAIIKRAETLMKERVK